MSAPVDMITLTRLDIEPATPTPIDAPIKLNFLFTSQQELAEAFWEFKVTKQERWKREEDEKTVW